MKKLVVGLWFCVAAARLFAQKPPVESRRGQGMRSRMPGRVHRRLHEREHRAQPEGRPGETVGQQDRADRG